MKCSLLTPCVEENGICASLSGATISLIREVEFSLNVSVIIMSSTNILGCPKNHTFASNKISIKDSAPQNSSSVIASTRTPQRDLHIVRFLVIQYCSHQHSTVNILLWTPSIPRVLAIVEIGEDCQFKCPIWFECESRFPGVWVQYIMILMAGGITINLWLFRVCQYSNLSNQYSRKKEAPSTPKFLQLWRRKEIRVRLQRDVESFINSGRIVMLRL